MKEMSKVFNCIFGLFLLLMFSSCLKAQSNRVDTVILGNRQVTINLPEPYKKKVCNYDEGIFIDYVFQNGSIITLFRGANQKLPLLSPQQGYTPIKKKQINSTRISMIGKKESRYWREDILGEIRILYDKVPMEDKTKYDAILDSISY